MTVLLFLSAELHYTVDELLDKPFDWIETVNIGYANLLKMKYNIQDRDKIDKMLDGKILNKIGLGKVKQRRK